MYAITVKYRDALSSLEFCMHCVSRRAASIVKESGNPPYGRHTLHARYFIVV